MANDLAGSHMPIAEPAETESVEGEQVASEPPGTAGERPGTEDATVAEEYPLTLELRRRMFRGVASNSVGQVIGLVTVFLLTPYILGRIGPTGYGLWVLLSSVIAYGGLLDLGISSAVIKFVAEFWARRDVDRIRTLLATVLRLYLGLGVLVLVLSVPLAAMIPGLLRIDPAQGQTASLLVLFMAGNLAVSLASAPATSVLIGLQRFDLNNIVGVGTVLLGALGTVAVLSAGWGVVGMVAWNIPVNLLGRALSVRLIRRVAPDLPIGYSGASWAMARRVFGLSSAILVTSVSGLLQKKTDEIVIGAFLVVSAVTPYSIGRQLSEVAHVVTDQLMRVILPIASELHAAADREQLRALYLASTRLTVGIFLSIALAVVLLARQIVDAWVGPGYEEAVPVITILAAASLLLTSQWPAGSILQGMARFRLVAVSSLASGILNLVMSIVLVQRLGIVGVAVGTLVPTAVETMGFIMPYTMWVLGVKPGRAFREVWLPALLPALPSALVLYGLREILLPTSLLMVGIVAICGGLTYGLVYLGQGVTAMERHTLADGASQLLAAAVRLRERDPAPK